MDCDRMPDYQKMYAVLCVAASEAITQLEDIPLALPAKYILQEALYKAEEMYVDVPYAQNQNIFKSDIDSDSHHIEKT